MRFIRAIVRRFYADQAATEEVTGATTTEATTTENQTRPRNPIDLIVAVPLVTNVVPGTRVIVVLDRDIETASKILENSLQV